VIERIRIVALYPVRRASPRMGCPILVRSSRSMVEKAPIRVSYEATNGTRESTVVSELSLGGVFVETQLKSPKVGSLVALEIESGATKVAIDGRVLSHSPKGFAVSFIDLPNDVASALHFILATKMPRRGTQLGLGEAEEGIAKYVSEPRLPAVPPSAPKPAEPPPPSVKPAAPAAAAPVVPETDAYAPRHPTPRIMPAAPVSSPPGPDVARSPYSAPPPPISSAPAMMVPNAPSSYPQMGRPPPSGNIDPAMRGSKKGVVIVLVAVMLLVVLAVVFAVLRR